MPTPELYLLLAFVFGLPLSLFVWVGMQGRRAAREEAETARQSAKAKMALYWAHGGPEKTLLD